MDMDTFCSYVAKNSLRIILKRQEAEPRASRESERYSVVIVVQYSDARSGDGKEDDGTTATTKSTFGLRESWRRALIGLLSC